ncbi:MAG: matrixin family metalloprotease [Pirellulaceae bacterium]
MKKRHARRLFAENLEPRLCLAASIGWDGPGFGSAALTYNISGAPTGLDTQSVQSALETAFAAWSNVADISFQPTSVAGQRDSIDIRFRNLDGPGGVLAQAYFPDDVNPARIAGDIEFDASENWEVGNAAGSAAFDLVMVAVHEIGHALGLDHSNILGSVMYPSVSPLQQFSNLAATDVDAVLALYAPAASNNAGDPNGTNDSGNANDPADNGGSDNTPTDQDDTPTRNERRFRNPWRSGRHWGGRSGRVEAEVLVAAEPTASASTGRHNATLPPDVNRDGQVSPLDALLVINQLNSASANGDSVMCDVNGDGELSPVDALMVINRLNGGQVDTAVAGESASDSTSDSESTDITPDPKDNTTPTTDNEFTPAEDTGDDDSNGDDTGADDTGTDDTHDCPNRDVPNDNLDVEQRRAARFGALDTNDDGLLTEDEVPTELWQRLSQFDADEDGAVSLAELPTHPVEGHAHGHGRGFAPRRDGRRH